jgi:hypothetical protein
MSFPTVEAVYTSCVLPLDRPFEHFAARVTLEVVRQIVLGLDMLAHFRLQLTRSTI